MVEAGLFLEVVAVLEEVAVFEVEAQELLAAVVIRSQIMHTCESMGCNEVLIGTFDQRPIASLIKLAVVLAEQRCFSMA